MKKELLYFTVSILILNILFAVITAFTKNSICFSLTITFGTILFHFVMRYIVGYLTPHCFKYNQKYFSEKPFKKAYIKL